jgi:L-alanine-DL-glutamate epimerase-like enolase superfamily enzyme
MAAGKQINEYWHALARILSDDGIEGFVYVVTFSAALVKPLADATRELADLLKGMHVFEPEASWAKLTRAANWVAGRYRQLRDRTARHCDVGCCCEGSQSAAV